MPGDQELFSYVLTKKQFDSIVRICSTQGWAPITCRGITLRSSDISHVLSARDYKDSVSPDFVANILAKAYCHLSDTYHNQPSRSEGEKGSGRSKNKQTIILNTANILYWKQNKFYAMAILEVVDDGGVVRLKPQTAYHANDKKARAIQGKKGK